MTVSIEPLRVLRIDWGRAFAWLSSVARGRKVSNQPIPSKASLPPTKYEANGGTGRQGSGVRSNPGSLSTVSALWRRLAAIRNSPARS